MMTFPSKTTHRRKKMPIPKSAQKLQPSKSVEKSQPPKKTSQEIKAELIAKINKAKEEANDIYRYLIEREVRQRKLFSWRQLPNDVLEPIKNACKDTDEYREAIRLSDELKRLFPNG
jgi:hypothetical protein